jgi:general secretion pathway protein G
MHLVAPPRRNAGFTLIELIVVMTIVALLLSMALPRYLGSLDRGREHVLQHDLAQMRQAIDRYHADRGVYPDSLDDLVARRYLRAVPPNPYTDAVDWQVLPPPHGAKGAVYDVIDPQAATRGAATETAPASNAPGDPTEAPQ